MGEMSINEAEDIRRAAFSTQTLVIVYMYGTAVITNHIKTHHMKITLTTHLYLSSLITHPNAVTLLFGLSFRSCCVHPSAHILS